MHSKAPTLSENSPTGTVNVGSEDCTELVENTSLQFQPLISLTRDYLARLLFWLVQLLFSPLGCLGLKIGPACTDLVLNRGHLCISLHILGMSSLKANSITEFWKISYSFWCPAFVILLFKVWTKVPAFVPMYCQYIEATCSDSVYFFELFVFLSYISFSFPP